MSAPLITVERIAVRQRDRWLLQGLSWRIADGEQWAVVGPNGAGKTTLAKAIAGLLPVVQGTIHYPVLGGISPTEGIAYAAVDTRRDLWRRERLLDHARHFSGRFNDATTVRRLIGARADGRRPSPALDAQAGRIASRFDLTHLLDKPAMTVSTGELSRVLIVRRLIPWPRMLILDEPFDGLDRNGRRQVAGMLDRLAGEGLPMILITHRQEELLDSTSHVLTLDGGRVVTAGPNTHGPSYLTGTAATRAENCTRQDRCRAPRPQTRFPEGADPLIEMKDVTVRFGDTVVLDRFHWLVREGEHWAVTGPNGAGKSTLLKLITGDCLQVYANRVRLFGKDRGPNQTLREVREQLGVVSHDLATAYQKRMTALDVVCSGFFDSVGLYRTCSAGQVDDARRWMERMGIEGFSRTPFNHLSQGQRQMVLIARAMVKTPRLLILDEPCAGLDPENRTTVLGLVERIGCRERTGLIVVSHHEQEIPRCMTHRLVLEQGRMVRCGAYRRETKEEARVKMEERRGSEG
jgi:molybdate transport system ATP-binding protein